MTEAQPILKAHILCIKCVECVSLVHAAYFCVFCAMAGTLCSQSPSGGVYWGLEATPDCHLFSAMWPKTDTVNHGTGGT